MANITNPQNEKKSSMYPSTRDHTESQVNGVVMKGKAKTLRKEGHPVEDAILSSDRDRTAEEDRRETTDKVFSGQFSEEKKLESFPEEADTTRENTGESRYAHKARGYNERGGGYGSFTGKAQDKNRDVGAAMIERDGKEVKPKTDFARTDAPKRAKNSKE